MSSSFLWVGSSRESWERVDQLSGKSEEEPSRSRPTLARRPRRASVPSTPREELQRRAGALQRHLQSLHLDAALINQNIDLFYFTGSMQSGMLIVPAAGEVV